jgi:hypothetical protein
VGLVPVTKKYWTGWGCPGEDRGSAMTDVAAARPGRNGVVADRAALAARPRGLVDKLTGPEHTGTCNPPHFDPLKGRRPHRPAIGGEHMALYDKADKMTRLTFCEERGIDPDTEARAREQGWNWPPSIRLGRRVFYSRQRVAEWFAERDRLSRDGTVRTAAGGETR